MLTNDHKYRKKLAPSHEVGVVNSSLRPLVSIHMDVSPDFLLILSGHYKKFHNLYVMAQIRWAASWFGVIFTTEILTLNLVFLLFFSPFIFLRLKPANKSSFIIVYLAFFIKKGESNFLGLGASLASNGLEPTFPLNFGQKMFFKEIIVLIFSNYSGFMQTQNFT